MTKKKIMVGWREWVSLPELGINRIKAKIDTGAKTSALHAFDVKLKTEGNKRIAVFKIHPHQDDLDTVINCTAEVFDERTVTDSGGHKEKRLVILTPIKICNKTIKCEVTLTDRDTMMFRMLVGRTTLNPYFTVDPQESYLAQPDLNERDV